MSVSRRSFLKSGALISAALVLKPGTFVLGQNSLRSNNSLNPVHSYSREMFEPYVGDIFRVRVGKQMVDLKLAALEVFQSASDGITTGKKIARTDCFSLRFHAARRFPATTGLHNLKHSKLGSFDLFMIHSEVGSKFQHTAIVNHLV
jgi:hypothetical protein